LSSSFAATAVPLPFSPDQGSPSLEKGIGRMALEEPGVVSRPLRTSSAASTPVEEGAKAGKPIRRAAAVGRRRLARSGASRDGSISSIADLDAEGRKSVNAFLAGEGESPVSSGRKKKPVQYQQYVETNGEDWDEAQDILAAYGDA
jgi:hypothetical protein